LVRDDREAEFVSVKIERAVLVGYRDANEFDLLDHDATNVICSTLSRPEFTAVADKKVLSIYRYSA
jgi:hypothetical protein